MPWVVGSTPLVFERLELGEHTPLTLRYADSFRYADCALWRLAAERSLLQLWIDVASGTLRPVEPVLVDAERVRALPGADPLAAPPTGLPVFDLAGDFRPSPEWTVYAVEEHARPADLLLGPREARIVLSEGAPRGALRAGRASFRLDADGRPCRLDVALAPEERARLGRRLEELRASRGLRSPPAAPRRGSGGPSESP